MPQALGEVECIRATGVKSQEDEAGNARKGLIMGRMSRVTVFSGKLGLRQGGSIQ